MYLSNGCVYKLNIDGQEKVFHSEQELDAFLSSHDFKVNKIDKTLSTDLQTSAINQLNEAKVAYDSSAIEVIRPAEDPEESEVYYKIPNSIGATKFITSYGNLDDMNKPLITPFNLKQWEINKLEEYKSLGISEIEAKRLIKSIEENLWKEYGLIGTDVHKVYECVLSNTEIPKLEHLSKDQLDIVVQQANDFKDWLHKQHGEDTIFLTEFAVKSKKLDPDLQTLLEEKGIDSLNGKVDLVVIDNAGQVHIYDYKVTSHGFGDRSEWGIEMNDVRKKLNLVSSTKKNTATYQLAIYNAILRQYGINTKSCNIVPINLTPEFSDDTHTSFKTVSDSDGKTHLSFTLTREKVLDHIPGTTSGKEFNRISTLIPVDMHVNSEETIEIAETMNKLTPNANVESSIKQFKADVEYYKKHPEVIQLRKIQKGSPRYDRGYRWSFKTHGLQTERWINCKTEEALEEQLNKFVEDLAREKTNELTTFADNLNDCINGKMDLKRLSETFDASKRNFIEQQFKKYIEQRWEFIHDEALNAAGFFLFRKDGVTEIVIVSNKPLLSKVNLGMGTSLLGKKVANENVNSKEIFDANYGNIEIMKGMLYVSKHQDLFKQFPIVEIRCINPWARTDKEVRNLNSTTLHNWNMLYMQNQDLITEIDSACFIDDVQALLNSAKTKGELVAENFIDFQLVRNAVDLAYNEKWFRDTIKRLRDTYSELNNPENYNSNSDLWQAYVYLNQALAASQGIYTLNETTPGAYFTGGGINPNGFLISAGQFSPSANIRVFSQIHDQYVSEVRNMVYKLGQKFQRDIKGFYREMKSNGFIGEPDDIFKSWFVLDKNGEIDDRFILKNPNSHDFDGRPKAKEALTEFINLMYELRHPKPTDPQRLKAWEEAKKDAWENEDEELFEVPLTEGRFNMQRKSLGWKKAFKNKWDEAKNLTQDVFAEDEGKEGNVAGKSIKEEYQIQNQSVYNKFRISGEIRREKLTEHGVGFFNIDLESVMNQALVAYCKEQVSKKYVPIFQAMRLSLQHMKGYERQTIQNTIDTFDKMLLSKFYGEPIMKEDLRPFWRYLNVLKKGFSVMTLGLNFGSMFRELFQGTFIGLSRSGVRMLPGLDVEHYLKGAGFVIKEAHKNFSSVSLLQQLNAQYGMANMSLSNLANQRRVDWFGIRNWNTDTLFLTASSPDFQHRMAILVGKMMQEGSWEAHSLDEDGMLVYDWKKDKRFEAYVNNRTDDTKYLEQKSLYLNYIREFNRIGYKKPDGTDYKEGDDLPMAYPPREQQTIKNFSDLLYGHYDDESKSLLNDTFIGSFFMQYKTFITAKLEQWTMQPGIYNTETLKQQYDPLTGDKLYIKTTYPNPDGTGIPSRKIIKERDLTEEDKKSNNLENYMKWEGSPMEGMFQSTMSFAKAIKSMDREQIKLIWQNPTKKAGLLLTINDLIICSLMMLILNALFSTGIGQDEWWNKAKTRKEMKDENWWTQWSYKVAIGSFEDGPFFNVITQMFTDVNPPLLTSLTKTIDTVTGLITGKKSVADAAVQNFGAIREFQGMVKAWEDTTGTGK